MQACHVRCVNVTCRIWGCFGWWLESGVHTDAIYPAKRGARLAEDIWSGPGGVVRLPAVAAAESV